MLGGFDCSHAQDILKVQLISLNFKEKNVSRPVEDRWVSYSDPESGEILEFITNLKGLDALTKAMLYKNIWVIEVLFKQTK